MYYYRINQCRLPIGHTEEDLHREIRKVLGLNSAVKLKPNMPRQRESSGLSAEPDPANGNPELKRYKTGCESAGITYEILRRSLDARKKDELFYSYVIELSSARQLKIGKRTGVQPSGKTAGYVFRPSADAPKRFRHRPVIIGMGPAGLFCGYMLAKAGCAPILIERGDAVEQRRECVDRFWKENRLDPESNVQFGEGGAGTFSDGKLNTLVKDRAFRSREVLETFVRFGAPADILYESKPHIGTDLLAGIVRNLREEILRLGGSVYFRTRLKEILVGPDHSLRAVVLEKSGGVPNQHSADSDRTVGNGSGGDMQWELPCDALILATGHSARDTFAMLETHGVRMEPKAFAVGVRVQHPQRMISVCQYGERGADILPPADYKLTGRTADGRGVYTFCMCPGGYVVNASSEPGHLAVNGMSYHDRAGVTANSALIVQVTPEDFGSSDPLGGVRFQRQLEKSMYDLTGGTIPVQLYEDFRLHRMSSSYGGVVPCFCGAAHFARLDQALPPFLTGGIQDGIGQFAKKIPGFDRGDVILAGIESRTSSPVRILRGEDLQSVTVRGIYPCGEGAGYAGGIMSAAMDGIRVYEALTGPATAKL